MVLDKPGKRYYVAKQFWRYIRPGAVRIAAGPDGGDKGVCLTAYQHQRDKTVTVVLLNRSDDNVKTTVALKTDLPVSTFDTLSRPEIRCHSEWGGWVYFRSERWVNRSG
jgi:hypothetical protein